jgi:hypothetical protein
MNQKKVWRYTCGFCSKGFFKPKVCLRHESMCIYNPDRKCGLCDQYQFNQTPLLRLASILDTLGLDVDALRAEAHGCPMCMLAAVAIVNRAEGWSRRSEEYWHLDYPAEVKRFEAEHSIDTSWVEGGEI